MLQTTLSSQSPSKSQTLLHNITGFPEKLPLDARILNGSCFVTALTALVSLIFNYITQAPDILNTPCFIGLGFASLAWYLGRIHHWFIGCLALLLITQMLGLSLAFIYNGGIKGPVAIFYITLAPIYIYILRPQIAIPITIVFFINVAGLYFAEIQQWISPIPYPNEYLRALDIFTTISLNFGLIVLITTAAKWLLLKEQQKTEEGSEAKSQFLANISHEIRTPMNAILNMTELALSKSDNVQQKIWLEGSHIAATHLLSLMEDMLDISSIDAGKLNIVKQRVNLSELIINTVNILKPLAEKKHLALHTKINSALNVSVETDPMRLRQILVNLINNAIKFTDKGNITITVSLKQQIDRECILLFSIRDTGIGINAEYQRLISNIFTHGKNLKASDQNFGLGLNITKQLVEKMGGDIWLDSNSLLSNSDGTTFLFTLPVQLSLGSSEKTPMINTPDTVTHDKISAMKENNWLLLVEDNEINIDVAKHILKRHGFYVDVCHNGQESLEKMAERKYAVILMDLEMPIMDGYTATIALRKGTAGPLNQHTPVIAITAHALEEYHQKAFDAGMQSFITKPLNADLLVQTIHAQMEKGQ